MGDAAQSSPVARSSVILPLWVSAFVFGHLFALFWFVRAALLKNPQLSLAGLLLRRSRGKGGLPQSSEDANRAGSLEAGVLADATDAAAATTSGRRPGDPSLPGVPLRKGVLDDHRAPRSSAGSGGHRSVAEVERIELEWQALSCSYRTNQGLKWVLKDIYGTAQPGEMQALLGPSGAGKSTLMDILAQRKSTGTLGGVMLVDGLPADSSYIRRTAYVPQHDNFVPVMTTMEVMQFYAGIILPRVWAKARRAARVDEVLQEMGLAHAARTLVGGQTPGGLLHRGLSGGERKRLSIATGILAAPSVVFLDEPTTGLDSFAALTVMGYMKRMARDNGHIVIASIHQPRSAIWSMFDTVTLLSCGRLMYTGICDGLVEFFHTIGFDYDANLHGVVSDWALDLVACGSHKPKKFYGNTITSKEEVRTVSAAFLARWMDLRGMTVEDLSLGGERDSQPGGTVVSVRKPPPRGGRAAVGSAPLSGRTPAPVPAPPAIGGGTGMRYAAAAAAAAAAASPARVGVVSSGGPADRAAARQAAAVGASADAEATAASMEPSSWWQQYWWTFHREIIMITRNPADVAGRTLTNTWVAATMGLLYYDIPGDTGALRGKVNMLLNILAFFCLMPYISMSLYTASKQFYLADVSAKLYTPSAYYLAKVTATLPFQLVGSLVFTFVLYGMAGLRNSVVAIWANGTLTTLMSLIAVQVMHLCAVIAPTQDVAFMYSIAWTAVQLLFNNFFITFKEASLEWLTNLKWISALYYAFEGMSVVEFSGVMLPCSGGMDPRGYQFLRNLLPNTRLLGLKAVQNGLTNPGPDCVADAGAVLEYFNFGRGFRATLGILVGYWLITHVLTYTAMVAVARKERR